MRATGPAQAPELLLDIVDLLNKFRIPYAVIGALAASYYGIPRSTTDADTVIWLKDTGKDAQELTDHFHAAGYQAELKRGDFDDPIWRSIIVEDAHKNRIDVLMGVRGMDPEAANRCITAPLLGSSVRIIGAEDLIGMKLFAGGYQDVEDVRGILQVSGDSLNLDLLRAVAQLYSANVAKELDSLLKELLPGNAG